MVTALEMRAESLALEQLKNAAREYARASSGDLDTSMSVLMCGARLRIAAKQWASAEREARAPAATAK